MNRRHFIEQSAKVAAGVTLAPFVPQTFAIGKGGIAPSDQVNIGVIGINGMGWSNLRAALQVQGVNLVALCDVDKNVLDRRMRELTEHNDMKPFNIEASRVQAVSDYRKMLDMKDVDAVIIGTPDHWHTLQMIDAVAAGKDVYVEKPIANSIGECNLMVAAQQKYNKVVQVGQWQRSQQHFQDAIAVVHSGILGNIRTVKAWAFQGWMKPPAVTPNAPAPAGFDYNAWLGPAPMRPYNAGRAHFNFRWFWDYAGGLMTDWGVHLVDYALYGMKAGMPKTIAALGGKFAYPDLAHETPDSLTTIYEFDRFILLWEQALAIDNGPYGRDHGIAFIGNNGTLVVNRNGWEIIEERRAESKIGKALQPATPNGLVNHWKNFVDVVRSRQMQDLNAPIQVGATVAKVCQMGNIAFRSGKRLVWDKARNQFTDAAVNRQFLMPRYQNGFRLPNL